MLTETFTHKKREQEIHKDRETQTDRADTHVDRGTERGRDGEETERETDKETETQTEAKRHRHRDVAVRERSKTITR